MIAAIHIKDMQNLLIIYVERKQQNRYEKNISFFISFKFYVNL